MYTGVLGSLRQLVARVPVSTASYPRMFNSRVARALASASSPAMGRALRSGAPAGRARENSWCGVMLLNALITREPARWRCSRAVEVSSPASNSATWPSRSG